jgi:hypothetical protein
VKIAKKIKINKKSKNEKKFIDIDDISWSLHRTPKDGIGHILYEIDDRLHDFY